MNPHGAEPRGEDRDLAEKAKAVVGALPAAPIDPAFARRVERTARARLSISRSPWKRTELLFARVLLPAAILLCALSWTAHVVHIAARIYVGHGG
jgi:hypothetical protein